MKINNFLLNTWIFVPNSLDINAGSYAREDFYKDVRTNIRLITPVFIVREIASGDAIPLRNLESAMKQLASSPTRSMIAEYEYQIKMFSAIYKSAIRDQMEYVFKTAKPEDKEELILNFLNDITDILEKYRQLAHIIKTATVTQVVYNYYLFGDEFMSNLTEKEISGLIHKLKTKIQIELNKSLIDKAFSVLEKEKTHKTVSNYLQVDPDSQNRNSELIFRLGALKKYIESDLFLNANKKREGVLAEQVYYSIAAGLSMIFATTVAFSFQQKFGSFTMPLFVALVVSYMLKDRIKELMRYYFAQKISVKYYDNKTTISVKDKEIGISKEGFDFIDESNIPQQILRMRNRIPLIEADNRHTKEKIILFRKSMKIDREILDQSTNYNIDGVVEIIRMNMITLMRKTDNPDVPLFVIDENKSVKKIMGTKNYFINIILQFKHKEDEKYLRYRVGFNRMGINSINEMS